MNIEVKSFSRANGISKLSFIFEGVEFYVECEFQGGYNPIWSTENRNSNKVIFKNVTHSIEEEFIFWGSIVSPEFETEESILQMIETLVSEFLILEDYPTPGELLESGMAAEGTEQQVFDMLTENHEKIENVLHCKTDDVLYCIDVYDLVNELNELLENEY